MKLNAIQKFLIAILILSLVSLCWGQEEGQDVPLSNPPDSLNRADSAETVVKSPLRHKRKRVKRAKKLSGWLSLESLYDHNILDYSRSDVSLLKRRPDSTKFRIKQPDDVITSLEGKVRFKSTFIRKHPSELGLDFNLDFYAVNSIRNYQVYQATFRQKLFPKNYLEVEQGFMPKYYLRNLYDRETASYQKAKLRRRWTGVEWQIQNLSRFDLGIGYLYQFTDYNKDFDERDTKAKSVGLKLGYQISKQVDSKISYSYVNRQAKGKDDPDTLIADISNHSHLLGLDFDFDLHKWLGSPLRFSQDFEYEWQSYTTDKRADKYHFHRKDNYFQTVSGLAYRVNARLIFYISYSYEDNHTNISVVNDPGSYTTHKVWAKIKYLF